MLDKSVLPVLTCVLYSKPTLHNKTDGCHFDRLDFHRLPGPVFDPPRRETAGRVTR